jgi:hypothetical protein
MSLMDPGSGLSMTGTFLSKLCPENCEVKVENNFSGTNSLGCPYNPSSL